MAAYLAFFDNFCHMSLLAGIKVRKVHGEREWVMTREKKGDSVVTDSASVNGNGFLKQHVRQFFKSFIRLPGSIERATI